MLAEAVEKSSSRPVFVYDMPEGVIDTIKSVGLVELTAEEELTATKRSRGDHMRLAYELAKQCLVEVNGAPVSLGDGSADKVWGSMGPKARNLVLTAYAEMHAPAEDMAQLFLKSRKVRVG
jgi:hypothetical protein